MSARREASKQLGFALEKNYQGLVNAVGTAEIAQASVHLGALFNENIEAIIYFLKAYGGVKQLPLEKRVEKKTAPLPKVPDFLVK